MLPMIYFGENPIISIIDHFNWKDYGYGNIDGLSVTQNEIEMHNQLII